MKNWEVITKRCLDLFVATTGLILASPLFLLITIAIRMTSSGRAIFKQVRLGKNVIPFTLYKFRTMVENAPDVRNADGSAFNGEDDVRVTRIGKFLRTTSLDELPQLFNVLNGTMSLVGPRPDQVDQIKYYTKEEWKKLYAKPGITGLAQINGRNSISWSERKQLDLEYVEQQSLRLDIEILLRTIPFVLQRKGIFIADNSLSEENNERVFNKTLHTL